MSECLNGIGWSSSVTAWSDTASSRRCAHVLPGNDYPGDERVETILRDRVTRVRADGTVQVRT